MNNRSPTTPGKAIKLSITASVHWSSQTLSGEVVVGHSATPLPRELLEQEFVVPDHMLVADVERLDDHNARLLLLSI